MSKYVVKYSLQDGSQNKIIVSAYSIFHAEKLAKEKLGDVYVTSIASVSDEKKE